MRHLERVAAAMVVAAMAAATAAAMAAATAAMAAATGEPSSSRGGARHRTREGREGCYDDSVRRPSQLGVVVLSEIVLY